jgi:glutamine cyclotransferase
MANKSPIGYAPYEEDGWTLHSDDDSIYSDSDASFDSFTSMDRLENAPAL